MVADGTGKQPRKGDQEMKLYIENGEVLFDFSDVDTKAKLDVKVSAYKKFLRDTSYKWDFTKKWNVMRMVYEPYSFDTKYSNERHFESEVRNCVYVAKTLDYIEVSPTVEELLQKTAVRCKELYEAELAKEKERERQTKWESLCKNGCQYCNSLRRCGDDYICTQSKNLLPEKTVTEILYGQYRLFNKPFPTDNCPYNVNKPKGVKNEHLREYCRNSG